MKVKDKNGIRDATPEEMNKINAEMERMKTPKEKDLDKLIVWAKNEGLI